MQAIQNSMLMTDLDATSCIVCNPLLITNAPGLKNTLSSVGCCNSIEMPLAVGCPRPGLSEERRGQFEDCTCDAAPLTDSQVELGLCDEPLIKEQPIGFMEAALRRALQRSSWC